MATYLPHRASRILEIGSLNVNGGLRDHAPRNATYIGLDVAAGAGVDHVVSWRDDWPVDDDSIDLVVASSAFEHDPAFWLTFLAMCRKARPGGYIYISSPANGKIHRHPHDCWRFYPDAGLALQDWARQQGIDVMLVESFTAEREHDVWNDFCAVFRRGADDGDVIADPVHDKVPSTNVISWRTGQLIRSSELPEDMRLIASAAEERTRWENHAHHVVHQTNQQVQAISAELAATRALLEQTGQDHAAAMAAYDVARAERDALRDERDQLRQASRIDTAQGERALTQKDAEIVRLGHTLATLESRLTQREEELSQAWAAARSTQAERDALTDALESAEARVEHERGWVHDLALTRTRLELRIAALDRAHAAVRLDLEREQRQSAALRGQIERLADAQTPIAAQSGRASPAQIHALEATVARLQGSLAESAAETGRQQQLAEHLQARDTQNTRELAVLGDVTASLQEELAQLREQNGWLRDVAEILLSRSAWWSALLPEAARRQRRDKILLARGLFDPEAYASRYPDVVTAGHDPLRHFIVHGMSENRKIS